jgi:hypothetical protein
MINNFYVYFFFSCLLLSAYFRSADCSMCIYDELNNMVFKIEKMAENKIETKNLLLKISL